MPRTCPESKLLDECAALPPSTKLARFKRKLNVRMAKRENMRRDVMPFDLDVIVGGLEMGLSPDMRPVRSLLSDVPHPGDCYMRNTADPALKPWRNKVTQKAQRPQRPADLHLRPNVLSLPLPNFSNAPPDFVIPKSALPLIPSRKLALPVTPRSANGNVAARSKNGSVRDSSTQKKAAPAAPQNNARPEGEKQEEVRSEAKPPAQSDEKVSGEETAVDARPPTPSPPMPTAPSPLPLMPEALDISTASLMTAKSGFALTKVEELQPSGEPVTLTGSARSEPENLQSVDTESGRLLEYLQHTVNERTRAVKAVADFYAENNALIPSLHDKLTSTSTPLHMRVRSPFTGRRLRGCIWRDYEVKLQWPRVMAELCQYFAINKGVYRMHRIRPITYSYLRPEHVAQVNALLCSAFWPGIDVSESLIAPEFTVVALYGSLVIGAALMTPLGYITYIVVRESWRRLGIAGVMLHLLIQTVPDRDITLHVSVSNSATLLYNRFGFKAEEYILDFYHRYLPKHSTLCPHALLLRLRR